MEPPNQQPPEEQPHDLPDSPAPDEQSAPPALDPWAGESQAETQAESAWSPPTPPLDIPPHADQPPPPPPLGRDSRGLASLTVSARPSCSWPCSAAITACAS